MVLATSSLGAVWSSSPPEFGVSAILERFTQLRPKVLLSADKYRVGGKEIDILPKLAEVVSKLAPGGLKHVVLVGQLDKDRRPRGQSPNFHAGVKSLAYPDFLDQSAGEIKFWRGPATAPLWVLYSSGTSGPIDDFRTSRLRHVADQCCNSRQAKSHRAQSNGHDFRDEEAGPAAQQAAGGRLSTPNHHYRYVLRLPSRQSHSLSASCVSRLDDVVSCIWPCSDVGKRS